MRSYNLSSKPSSAFSAPLWLKSPNCVQSPLDILLQTLNLLFSSFLWFLRDCSGRSTVKLDCHTCLKDLCLVELNGRREASDSPSTERRNLCTCGPFYYHAPTPGILPLHCSCISMHPSWAAACSLILLQQLMMVCGPLPLWTLSLLLDTLFCVRIVSYLWIKDPSSPRIYHLWIITMVSYMCHSDRFPNSRTCA